MAMYFQKRFSSATVPLWDFLRRFQRNDPFYAQPRKFGLSATFNLNLIRYVAYDVNELNLGLSTAMKKWPSFTLRMRDNGVASKRNIL